MLLYSTFTLVFSGNLWYNSFIGKHSNVEVEVFMIKQKGMNGEIRNISIELLEPNDKGLIIVLKFFLLDDEMDSNSLRMKLDPRIKLDSSKGRIVSYKNRQSDQNWFEFDYIIYDSTYGHDIYKKLKARLSC